MSLVRLPAVSTHESELNSLKARLLDPEEVEGAGKNRKDSPQDRPPCLVAIPQLAGDATPGRRDPQGAIAGLYRRIGRSRGWLAWWRHERALGSTQRDHFKVMLLGREGRSRRSFGNAVELTARSNLPLRPRLGHVVGLVSSRTADASGVAPQ